MTTWRCLGFTSSHPVLHKPLRHPELRVFVSRGISPVPKKACSGDS